MSDSTNTDGCAPGDAASNRWKHLKPFKKGYDPRRGEGGRRTSRLRARLKKFDEAAWATLQRMFASEDPALELEALKFWGKYRLDVLLRKPTEDVASVAVPTLKPEVAAVIAELNS